MGISTFFTPALKLMPTYLKHAKFDNSRIAILTQKNAPKTTIAWNFFSSEATAENYQDAAPTKLKRIITMTLPGALVCLARVVYDLFSGIFKLFRSPRPVADRFKHLGFSLGRDIAQLASYIAALFTDKALPWIAHNEIQREFLFTETPKKILHHLLIKSTQHEMEAITNLYKGQLENFLKLILFADEKTKKLLPIQNACFLTQRAFDVDYWIAENRLSTVIDFIKQVKPAERLTAIPILKALTKKNKIQEALRIAETLHDYFLPECLNLIFNKINENNDEFKKNIFEDLKKCVCEKIAIFENDHLFPHLESFFDDLFLSFSENKTNEWGVGTIYDKQSKVEEKEKLIGLLYASLSIFKKKNDNTIYNKKLQALLPHLTMALRCVRANFRRNLQNFLPKKDLEPLRCEVIVSSVNNLLEAQKNSLLKDNDVHLSRLDAPISITLLLENGKKKNELSKAILEVLFDLIDKNNQNNQNDPENGWILEEDLEVYCKTVISFLTENEKEFYNNELNSKIKKDIVSEN